MKRREFRHISAALGGVRESSIPDTALAQVQEVWLASVGQAIAENATPVGESDGVLYVSCASSVWAQELELLSSDLLKKLNAKLSGPCLRQIWCKTQAP